MSKPTLDQAPRRDAHLSAGEKISQALRWVGRKEPIAVPTVLTRWEVLEDRSCPTLSTNGKVLKYNPDFVDRLSFNATKAIVLHEVGHVLSQHQHRRQGRDHRDYNIAADLALNCLLNRGYRAAFNGDFGALYAELIDPSAFASGCFVGAGSFADLPPNLDAEAYYELLKQKASEKEQNQGQNFGQNFGQNSGQNRGEEGPDCSGDGGRDSDQDCSGEGLYPDPAPDQVPDDGQACGGKGRDRGQIFGQGHGPIGGSFAQLFDCSPATGDIEDSPTPESEHEDGQSILLETLLNHEAADKYSPLGLGAIISGVRDQLFGDYELAAAINWRAVLEEFLANAHAGQPSYERINRRLHSLAESQGIILPTDYSRNKTNGAVLVDTSGSMGDTDCAQALAHLGKILALFPDSTVNLVQCDTEVHCSEEYTGGDFPPQNWAGWCGRGGTDLSPGFRFIRQQGESFDWCIVITDGEFIRDGLVDPGVPTLWVLTRPGYWADKPFPFGRVVSIRAAKN
jgi:predicted metal-dependent peptidase